MKLAKSEAETELEIVKKQLESQLLSVQKKTAAESELALKQLRDDAASNELEKKQMREQLTELTKAVRAANHARDNAELDMQKKLAEEESKIRDEATKTADEKQRLNLAAKDKQLQDAMRVNEELQRKLQQGSQQMQGEIMELDFEAALTNAFRDDDIEPVAKGVKGGDVSQLVRSPRGTACGTILWEIKRTKNWVDGWVPKLKQDMRAARAEIAVIITESMPKQIEADMGLFQGIWVAKPGLAIALGSLLRKSLLDVGLQKARTEHQGGKAEALYNFVTSHEFIQQVELMVETYQEMNLQVQKERVAYERLWSQREKQSQKLLLGTANIIGSMQGHIGQAAMPRIKGLELDDDEIDAPDEISSGSQPSLL
ncbi:DUF2130 domain-containing protein [Microbacteriaceae bacterium]|nr:DUF2130 domain-containing protein [Candidatus Saccharibacteria bacterium]